MSTSSFQMHTYIAPSTPSFQMHTYRHDDAEIAYSCPSTVVEADKWQEKDNWSETTGASCSASLSFEGNYGAVIGRIGSEGSTWGCEIDKGEAVWYSVREKTSYAMLCELDNVSPEYTIGKHTITIINSLEGGSTLRVKNFQRASSQWNGKPHVAIDGSAVSLPATIPAPTATLNGEGDATTIADSTNPISASPNGSELTASASLSSTGRDPSSLLTALASVSSVAYSITAQDLQNSSASTAASPADSSSAGFDNASSGFAGLSTLQLALVGGGVALLVIGTILAVVCMRRKTQRGGNVKDEERSLRKRDTEKRLGRASYRHDHDDHDFLAADSSESSTSSGEEGEVWEREVGGRKGSGRKGRGRGAVSRA